MLCILWAQVETLFQSLHDLCAQLGTREIRAGTTFTTWNHVTLDVMQRHSRDYYSLSSLGLHQYYTSQHGKYNYIMALLSLCACARYATHNMIKTHTTRAHENTSITHVLHHMNEMHHKY